MVIKFQSTSKYQISCRSYQTWYVFTLQSSHTKSGMTFKDAFAVHCGLNPDLTSNVKLCVVHDSIYLSTLSNWVKNSNFKGPIFAILALTVAVRKICWEQIVSFKSTLQNTIPLVWIIHCLLNGAGHLHTDKFNMKVRSTKLYSAQTKNSLEQQ